MNDDKRIKHSLEERNKAIEYFEKGLGKRQIATLLNMSSYVVREWIYVYQAFGREEFLKMGGSQIRYTYEQKVAAVQAIVDEGMIRQNAMEKFKIRSLSSLRRWCTEYRSGGCEALKTKRRADQREQKQN